MRIGKIGNVNVVPDGGAVRRGIVGSEHRKIVDMRLDRHHRPWNEMGFRIAQLTEFALRIDR